MTAQHRIETAGPTRRKLVAVRGDGGVRPEPIDRWTRFRTRRPGEARDFIASNYGAREIRIITDPDSYEFSVRQRHLGHFSVDILDHRGHLDLIGGRGDAVPVVEVLHGRLVVRTAGGGLSLEAGSAVMTTVDEPRKISWDDVRLVLVRLDARELRRYAAELAGVDPGTVQFGVRGAASAERARHWSAAARYVVQGVLDNPAAAASPLALRESFRLLAATALEAFPQMDFSLPGSRPDDAVTSPPATVRRAVEFIEAHAHTDITVADIARVARLSVRATQNAFTRHLGTSPAAYLRQVRLAGVHRDLIVADPTAGTNVADIAAEWGFLHHGHFAASYRERYGVLPSYTLMH